MDYRSVDCLELTSVETMDRSLAGSLVHSLAGRWVYRLVYSLAGCSVALSVYYSAVPKASSMVDW
jgi:hypothetical protein